MTRQRIKPRRQPATEEQLRLLLALLRVVNALAEEACTEHWRSFNLSNVTHSEQKFTTRTCATRILDKPPRV